VSVQLDQAGPYVLVVGGDDKVETRRITLAAPDGAQVVVQRGLETGDKVIVDGIQKVRPDVAVTASEAAPPGAPQGDSPSQQSKG
jgi:membrane fusion protein, multidrug efflux system